MTRPQVTALIYFIKFTIRFMTERAMFFNPADRKLTPLDYEKQEAHLYEALTGVNDE